MSLFFIFSLSYLGSYFVSRAVLNASFFACLIAGLVLLARGWNAPQRWFRLSALCFAGVVGSAVASWAFSPYRLDLSVKLMSKEFRIWCVYLLALVFALLAPRFSRKQLRAFFYVTLLGLGILSVIGVIQWLGFHVFHASARITGEADRLGSHGWHYFTIQYAYQLFPIVVFLGTLLMDRDITRGISSLYFGAACAVCFIGLTALFTSTNRAAPAVTVAVLALAPLRKSARSALAGLFLAACAGTAVLLWTPLGNRFREISGEYSAQMRRAIWAGNLTAWEKHPIFGIGRQLNHEQVMRDEVPKEFTRTLNDFEMSYSAHSLYIDALSGSGVVGFAATMGFWIVIPATLVWGRRRELRARTSASAVVWAFAMAYLAWFLGALTESSLDVSHNRMALCVLYGGLVGGLLIFEEDASSYDPRGRSGYEKRRQSV